MEINPVVKVFHPTAVGVNELEGETNSKFYVYFWTISEHNMVYSSIEDGISVKSYL